MAEAILEADPKTVVERFSLADQRVKEFRANYAPLLKLTVADLSDAKTFEQVRLARAECRTERVAVEKHRKEKVEDAVKFQRVVNAKAKAITAEIEAIEDPLDALIKAKEEEKDRIRREAEEAERARIEQEQVRPSKPRTAGRPKNSRHGNARLKPSEKLPKKRLASNANALLPSNENCG